MARYEDKSTSELIEKALRNASSDIAELDEFMKDLMVEAQSRSGVLSLHEVSPMIAKLYEVRQKSNDQIIKLAAITQKSEMHEDSGETEFDLDSIYDKISEEEQVQNDE